MAARLLHRPPTLPTARSSHQSVDRPDHPRRGVRDRARVSAEFARVGRAGDDRVGRARHGDGDSAVTSDQPPGVPYVYGAAVRLDDVLSKARGGAGVRSPSEDGKIVLPPELAAQLPPSVHAEGGGPLPRWAVTTDTTTAQAFLSSGDDPERLAFAARLATIVIASLLGLMVAVCAWRTAPSGGRPRDVALRFLPDGWRKAAARTMTWRSRSVSSSRRRRSTTAFATTPRSAPPRRGDRGSRWA